jgi:hypothetical protein
MELQLYTTYSNAYEILARESIMSSDHFRPAFLLLWIRALSIYSYAIQILALNFAAAHVTRGFLNGWPSQLAFGSGSSLNSLNIRLKWSSFIRISVFSFGEGWSSGSVFSGEVNLPCGHPSEEEKCVGAFSVSCHLDRPVGLVDWVFCHSIFFFYITNVPALSWWRAL